MVQLLKRSSKKIKTNTNKDEAITYIRPFHKRYVEIEKEAYTSEERYYYIKYNRENLGWVKARSIQRVHKMSKISPLNIYFRTKMCEMEKNNPVRYSSKLEWTLKYGMLIQNNTKIACFSKPEDFDGGEEKTIPEEYKND